MEMTALALQAAYEIEQLDDVDPNARYFNPQAGAPLGTHRPVKEPPKNPTQDAMQRESPVENRPRKIRRGSTALSDFC